MNIEQANSLTNQMTTFPGGSESWGAFADDPEFEEAIRLGREYRESLRPRDDEENQWQHKLWRL